MNQYRCETCSYYLKYAVACNKIKERLIVGADEWIDKVGCASHSDFQSEREKVLDAIDIELDEVKSRIESSAMGQPLSERSRGEIIGLLHAREKIKYLREGKGGE